MLPRVDDPLANPRTGQRPGDDCRLDELWPGTNDGQEECHRAAGSTCTDIG